eukprot:TRINITY_DN69646_c0_g1_i1.p1 TRINITY_DN69646_c0_g1~~TRINITY_DN69646_c0_g1_i1.p1  ORF type:complete len:329 (-),score=65.01 TRINITY_DN69646_c0_g1_i1:452-1438(-)
MGKKAAPASPPVEVEKEEVKEEPKGEQLEGEFIFPDGSTYSGQYLKLNDDVCLHGTGQLKTGPESFVGTFEKGAYKDGLYTACSGALYKGTFRNNLFHGVGNYNWADGRAYRGCWKDGLMHGPGQFMNFSFGVDHCFTGFSVEGRYASNRDDQETMKQRFLETYCGECSRSACLAIKDLASRATPEGCPKEFFVLGEPPAGEEEKPEMIAERALAVETVAGPFPEPASVQQLAIQAIAARLEEGAEGPLSPVVIEDLAPRSPSSSFDVKRLKKDQLRYVGQCVEFAALDALEPGSLRFVVLVNISAEYDIAKARWKLVHVEEVPTPAA